MTERDLELRINRNANRRHEIYRLLEDVLIGVAEREKLAAEIAGLEQDADVLYRELRIIRAQGSHRAAVRARTTTRWPIVSMKEDPAPENITPADAVERRRSMRRGPISRPTAW